LNLSRGISPTVGAGALALADGRVTAPNSVSIPAVVKHPDNPPHVKPIAISVVVPVRDEEESIRALLEGLLNQTRQPDEIVITDGGSVDRTRTIIEEFIAQGAPVRLVVDENSLPGRSRNLAVANARNQWIAFTDAGIKPNSNWLEALTAKVSDGSQAEVVYGSYEPIIDSFFKECAAIAYVPPAAVSAEGSLRPYSIVSALMRREAWERAGGFPENLRSAEDLLFMNRVEAAGFRIVRAPQAQVSWNIQPGLWRTFKRFVVYARNNIRAGLWRSWQAPIFLRYALLAVTALPAIVLGVKWLLVPLLLWLAFMTARALRALRQNRFCYPASAVRNLLRLTLVVPIITVIDLATFVGTAAWLMLDWLRTDSHDSR
jgi:glycosyltransferase involved in cell wall biosynthesis